MLSLNSDNFLMEKNGFLYLCFGKYKVEILYVLAYNGVVLRGSVMWQNDQAFLDKNPTKQSPALLQVLVLLAEADESCLQYRVMFWRTVCFLIITSTVWKGILNNKGAVTVGEKLVIKDLGISLMEG